MKKGALVVGYHLKNKIFDLADSEVNRDNSAHWLWLMRQKLAEVGVSLATYDINKPSESEVIFYFDINSAFKLDPSKKNVLFLLEPEAVKPRNWDVTLHDAFDIIFTWSDDLCDLDDERYCKINYSQPLPESEVEFVAGLTPFHDRKHCCLIAGNKASGFTRELYSERRKAIRWYEKNDPRRFDLFGVGWSQYTFRYQKINSILKRLGVKRLSFSSYPSYKGKVVSKKETLSQYRFSICYENELGTRGYITEKIFDCFFAGNVPVYLGASNIFENVPSGCFIDKNKFANYSELNEFLAGLSECDFDNYLNNIKDYLFSEKSKEFSSENFATVVAARVELLLK